jgi:hypothetical protein
MTGDSALLTFSKALADANRLRVIGLLAHRPHSVEELATVRGPRNTRPRNSGSPGYLSREVAFGPHARIAELFRRAAHPLRPLHPALARPP